MMHGNDSDFLFEVQANYLIIALCYIIAWYGEVFCKIVTKLLVLYVDGNKSFHSIISWQ